MKTSISDLIIILSNPEKQSMNILIDACKEAAEFIKNEKIIYEKGVEFAKLFSTDRLFESNEIKKPIVEAPSSLPQDSNTVVLKAVPGAYNIYMIGTRSRKNGIDRIEILKAIREASGDVNEAPRITLQKANELLTDLDLGDRVTFLRSSTSIEEANEIIKDLAAVGILAEIKK